MKGQKKKIRRKKILFERYPYCFWCGIEVLWLKNTNGKLPHNAATIDHLYSKMIGRKNYHTDHEERTVLACYKCNWDRGRQEYLAFRRRGIIR